MKNYRFFVIMVMLLMIGTMNADNLSVPNLSLAASESKGLDIELVNPTKLYTAFQFDMVLPEGVSIAKDSNSKYYVTLSSRKSGSHTITVDLVKGNTYRLISYSGSNETFGGNSGTLLTVPLVAATDINDGVKIASITNQIFTDPDGIQSKWSNVNFNITLSEVSSTITAKSYTIKYGDELPTFEFTSEGATVEGTPAITCEATKTSAVGTYPIVITKGSVTNYNTTFVNGTLTIEKAPLTITAKSYTIKQGETLPTFEAEYSGFKNNETKAVLTTQPTITTTATSTSESGEYDIIVSGAEAQNYVISYVAGKLTITVSDGIRMISSEHPVSVFDIQGHKVRSNVTSLEGLPKGVYIINGKKVVVK